MAFRNIIIESPAQISLKNKQLIIKTDSTHSVAVEDISALLIESRASSKAAAPFLYAMKSTCHVPCLSRFRSTAERSAFLRLSLRRRSL